jgi:hypothetical protein
VSDDEQPEERPDILAGMDQLLRGLVDVARIVRAYYTALVEQGFTESEAMILTCQYQTGLQGGGKVS